MKKKLLLSLIAICFIFSVTGSFVTKAAGPLDEIQNFTVDASTSLDGIVTLKYTIDWKVLDSTTEGPLSWVQVGVPNSAYEITVFGGDAASAVPYNSGSESKVRVDLSREFKAGEVASFTFTINQYNLLERDGDGYRCDFVPGWFDGIAVKNLIVRWLPENVTQADTDKSGDIYIWSGSLAAGEHFKTVTTRYGSNITPAEFAGTISESQDSGSSGIEILMVVLFVVAPIAVIIIAIVRKGPYNGGRGFYGGYRGGGFHGGCACACAGCACACACAGGGRAGCAKKDFTSFDADDSHKSLGYLRKLPKK